MRFASTYILLVTPNQKASKKLFILFVFYAAVCRLLQSTGTIYLLSVSIRSLSLLFAF